MALPGCLHFLHKLEKLQFKIISGNDKQIKKNNLLNTGIRGSRNSKPLGAAAAFVGPPGPNNRPTSQEKAAEVAGVSRSDFIFSLTRFEGSPFQYTAEEIEKELRDAD
jgi:hypothetical protein